MVDWAGAGVFFGSASFLGIAMAPSDGMFSVRQIGKAIRRIRQRGIPFKIPLGIPLANPSSPKTMLFQMRYKVSGLTLEEAREGIMFADFNSLMEIHEETCNRENNIRYLRFNPFTREMERMGGKFGEFGKKRAHNLALFMVEKLGLIEWEMSLEPDSGPDCASVKIIVTNKLFSGHFKIRVLRCPDGVILEDDWTPAGGAEVKTDYLAMANLVLVTHPRGFELITDRIVYEVEKARKRGAAYRGETCSPPAGE